MVATAMWGATVTHLHGLGGTRGVDLALAEADGATGFAGAREATEQDESDSAAITAAAIQALVRMFTCAHFPSTCPSCHSAAQM